MDEILSLIESVSEGFPTYSFILSFSEVNQSFSCTSRYLDDLFNVDNKFFDSMFNHIYSSELQLDKANVSDTEASFLNLHLSISDGFVKIKKLMINEMTLILIL